MGYLKIDGKLLTYNDYKDKIKKYKEHGINQFLRIYDIHKDKQKKREELKWGEEIEYQLFYFKDDEKKLQLSNKGFQLIQEVKENDSQTDIVLQPEFGNWMIEAVPGQPYNSVESPSELLSSFEKLRKRRNFIEFHATDYGLSLSSMTSPLILGTPCHININCDQELVQKYKDQNGHLEEINNNSKSKFIIDGTENPHPRFPGLVKSIRERRTEKVKILIPIYPDKKTNLQIPTEDEPFPGQIYMDSMHFGMGNSCLQITYETQNINHARYLHDMMLPFTPIMAALSQAAPIQKGKLADHDMRWTVISQSVDDRNPDERNPQSSNFVPKSRYSTMNHYLSNHEYVKDKHIDTVQYKVSPDHMKTLLDAGLDQRLAFHISSLFVRDPQPTYSNEHEDTVNDDETMAHFENLQSTNWNSMRFKPPPSKDSPIGWRVEFRTMDIQLTDFENTALIVLTGMIVNIINNFDLDFIMPISLIDENMDRAHKRDAIFKEKFWFKTSNIRNLDYQKNSLVQSNFEKSEIKQEQTLNPDEKAKEEIHELTLDEILNGKSELNYKGLYPLIEEFMVLKGYNKEEVGQIKHYLSFLSARAKGEVPSGARYMRDFVINHPNYKQDSIVTNDIAYDLMSKLVNINDASNPERSKLLGKQWQNQ